MRAVSMAEALDAVLANAEAREKTAKIHTDPKAFFVHVRVPDDVAAHLKTIQRKVLPDPKTHAAIDHVTLVYTRKPEDDHPPEKVHAALSSLEHVGQQTEPIPAKVQGWAYFDGAATGGKTNTALVALLDAPGLEHLHVDMARALKNHGIHPSDTHSFTPHITFGYLGDKGRAPGELPPINASFTINKVHVAARDHHAVPLTAKTARDMNRPTDPHDIAVLEALLGTPTKTAAMDKEAIGKKQWRRIEEAMAKNPITEGRGAESLRDWHLLEDLNNAEAPGAAWHARRTLDELFSPHAPTLPYLSGQQHTYDRQKREALAYLWGHRTPGSVWHDDPDALRRAREYIKEMVRSPRPDYARIEAELASGRHHPRDVVDLPPTDALIPGQEAHLPGVHPERIAWRSADSLVNEGEGPRWTSAIPSVSAGYAQGQNPVHARLTAHDITNIPDAAQGPWTPHIATDPRVPGTDITKQTTGAAPIGASPIYEKVIDAPHIPPPLATYKPLPTPFRFMRTQGPNLLRGELPAVVKTLAKHGAAWTDKIPGGLSDDKKPSDFPTSALAKGIKVEMEHTSSRPIATEIAMDHLTEDKKYYDKLEKIEKKGALGRAAAEFAMNPRDVQRQRHDAPGKGTTSPAMGGVPLQGSK